MARQEVRAEARIQASPGAVYAVLADYRVHHPRIMPPSRFSDLRVEDGGIGAGTVFRITLRVAGRSRTLHMRVDEPDPGRVLTETDLDTGAVTTFTVEPGDGGRTRAVMTSELPTTGGLAGSIERLIAPWLTRRAMASQLQELDRYMHSGQAPQARPAIETGGLPPTEGGTP